MAGPGSPARPPLIRALNEQLLLDHIRAATGVSRAELSRISGLAKNTVSLALANLERAELVRVSGRRTGVPGPAAVLYEVRPEAGFVLGLDVGRQFVRGAVSDISGTIRTRAAARVRATTGTARVAELVDLAASLLGSAGITQREITQTVLGSPGVHDPRGDRLALAGALPGWARPAVLTDLRRAFGPELIIVNDVDAAALAEQAHGHGRGVDNFAVVSIGTGIGMGVVLGGQLYRGHHGAAGEIGFMPLDADPDGGTDGSGPKRRHDFETSASAAGVVRAARQAGFRGPLSARRAFAAAQRGEPWAVAVVDREASLVARAVCAVVTVIDPQLIVLGGGIGRATGFAEAVAARLRRLSPVVPEVKVSALGADAVVDGCLAAGTARAWQILTAAIPTTTAAQG